MRTAARYSLSGKENIGVFANDGSPDEQIGHDVQQLVDVAVQAGLFHQRPDLSDAP